MKNLLSICTALILLYSCSDSPAPNSSLSNEIPASKSGEPAPKEWKEIFSLKGSGSKKSGSFHLSGEKARVRYKAMQAGLFSFYVVPDGEDVMETGGFPEVMTQEKEESEAYLTKPEGDYYLNMNATGKWEVIVEEMK